MRPIAHVVFLDIVRYSLLGERQKEAQRLLRQWADTLPAIAAARAAGQLRELPRGDGFALVFSGDIRPAVESACQLARAARQQRLFEVRLGIHSGHLEPSDPSDPNSEPTGEGIDTARRVLDSADSGHILLSEAAARRIQADPLWGPLLHGIGLCEVKHEVLLKLFSLHGEWEGQPIGNEVTPRAIYRTRQQQEGRAERDNEREGEHRRQERLAAIGRSLLYLCLLPVFFALIYMVGTIVAPDIFRFLPRDVPDLVAPTPR